MSSKQRRIKRKITLLVRLDQQSGNYHLGKQWDSYANVVVAFKTLAAKVTQMNLADRARKALRNAEDLRRDSYERKYRI